MPVVITLSLLTSLLSGQAGASTGSARIAGRVVEDGTHAPVAGARVIAYSAMPRRGGPGVFPLETTTDQEGRFVIEVTPGSYRLNAEKTGFASAIQTSRESASIDVAVGEVRGGIEIVLRRGGAIAGRVVDPNGEPLAYAHVSAMQRGSPQRGAAPIARPFMFQSGPGGQTNDLGEFRLFDLPPGEYIVLASPRQEFGRPGTSAPQSATIVAPTYFPGALDPLAAQPVTVTAGQTAGDVVIRMAVVPAFQIAGLVVDESDKPVDGAVVTMMPEVSPGGFTPRPPMPGPGFVRSDAAGRFVITNVTNGSYRVAASIPVAVRTVTTRTGSGDGMVKTQILGTAISGSTAVVSNGVVTGGTYTDPQSGRMFQYTTAGAQAVAVTVADANVSDVRLVAVSPQQ